MRVRARMQVAIGWSIPPLEVGATTFLSCTPCGADGVRFAVGIILADCGRSLAFPVHPWRWFLSRLGNGHILWFLLGRLDGSPLFKYLSEIIDGFYLGLACDRWDVLEGAGEHIYCMGYFSSCMRFVCMMYACIHYTVSVIMVDFFFASMIKKHC